MTRIVPIGTDANASVGLLLSLEAMLLGSSVGFFAWRDFHFHPLLALAAGVGALTLYMVLRATRAGGLLIAIGSAIYWGAALGRGAYILSHHSWSWTAAVAGLAGLAALRLHTRTRTAF